MKKLQPLSMANQRRICASLYLGVCAAALGRSGVLLTLGQYVPLSLACHGRDYMLWLLEARPYSHFNPITH